MMQLCNEVGTEGEANDFQVFIFLMVSKTVLLAVKALTD